MNVQLYNKTVKLIFTAVLVLAIASIIQPFTSFFGGVQEFGSDVSKALGAGGGVGFYQILRWIINLVVIGATAMFVWGLFNLKGIVDGPEAQGAVNFVFLAAAIAVLSAILSFFLGGILLGLINIAVAVLYILGYNGMKTAPGLPEPARQGAGLLFVGAILQIVAAVISLIPVVGPVLGFIISIAAFVLYIVGWKKIATPVA